MRKAWIKLAGLFQQDNRWLSKNSNDTKEYPLQKKDGKLKLKRKISFLIFYIFNRIGH